MKELSIEEKAKAYDEAIEKLRSLHDNYDTVSTLINIKEELENIFHKLVESEDDRIRKEIIAILKYKYELYPKDPKYCNAPQWIAWLEKQGEPTEINPSEFDSRLNSLLNQFKSLPKEELVSGLSFYLNMLQNDDTYKKEIADKVEPKFKNGQWIVWQDKCYKVNYNGCGYELVDQNSLSTSLEYGTIDENAHLWEITKDAKDGDVLVASDGSIFILKGTIDCACKYYVALTTDDVVEINEGLEHYWETSTAVHPATKEQRDTLFAKMKEKDYEWNAEMKVLMKIAKKKELKKIDVPIFNIGDTIIKKHNSDINDFGSFIITNITGGKYWYKDRIICDITKQDEWELYEPVRPKYAAWSEEDERMFKSALWHIKKSCGNGGKNSGEFEVYNWFKSLKERYTWKPSDEQMDALKNAIHIKPFENPSDSLLWGLYEQLKCLSYTLRGCY